MIEFRNEGWCRWNGTLMSPKNCKKLFGTEYEIFVEDGFIDDGETIYTDMPINEILLKFGEIHKAPEPYDPVLNLNSVTAIHQHSWEESLAGKIVFDVEFIKNLKIKPMKAFKKDYPKFNQELHDQFYDELDAYYENMRNENMHTYE